MKSALEGEVKFHTYGTSLEVPWLRLRASPAGDQVSIPGQGVSESLLVVSDSATPWTV